MKAFAPGLALKQRRKATRKWATDPLHIMGVQPNWRTKQNKCSLLGIEMYSHVRNFLGSIPQIGYIPTDLQGVYSNWFNVLYICYEGNSKVPLLSLEWTFLWMFLNLCVEGADVSHTSLVPFDFLHVCVVVAFRKDLSGKPTWYAVSSSAFRFMSFSFCSEKLTNWSNAFLLTWLYLFSSSLHLWSFFHIWRAETQL